MYLEDLHSQPHTPHAKKKNLVEESPQMMKINPSNSLANALVQLINKANQAKHIIDFTEYLSDDDKDSRTNMASLTENVFNGKNPEPKKNYGKQSEMSITAPSFKQYEPLNKERQFTVGPKMCFNPHGPKSLHSMKQLGDEQLVAEVDNWDYDKMLTLEHFIDLSEDEDRIQLK